MQESAYHAVEFAKQMTTRRPSIVNGSIPGAVAGEFGDAQFTTRSNGSELFINPLMGIYSAFDLPGLARRSLYLDRLTDTETAFDVARRIEAFRHETQHRPRRIFPH